MGGKGSGGHNRKPTARLKLTGTYNVTRHADRKDDQLALGDVPACPAEGKHAKELWHSVVDYLPPGILGQMDCALFAGACEMWQTYRDLYDTGQRDKAFRLLPELAKLMGRLGLTPTDRGKLNIPDIPKGPAGVPARKRG